MSTCRSPSSVPLTTNGDRRSDSIADKLAVEAKALADLKAKKAAVEGERRTVEADSGPVRYLATLIGAGDQDVLRYFILVVALLLDPAAVLLLLAAASAGHRISDQKREHHATSCELS